MLALGISYLPINNFKDILCLTKNTFFTNGAYGTRVKCSNTVVVNFALGQKQKNLLLFFSIPEDTKLTSNQLFLEAYTGTFFLFFCFCVSIY